MNDSVTLRRLRAFLRLLAAGLFVGTVAELLSVKHYGDRLQLIPFALCGLGLLALVAVWKRPTPWSVLALRVVMIAIVLGSLVGVYQHVTGNIELVREIRPNADRRQVIDAALTGRNPLGASGVLAIGAALAIAATYRAGSVAMPAAEDERVGARSGRPSTQISG